jgi:hypothetical protein
MHVKWLSRWIWSGSNFKSYVSRRLSRSGSDREYHLSRCFRNSLWRYNRNDEGIKWRRTRPVYSGVVCLHILKQTFFLELFSSLFYDLLDPREWTCISRRSIRSWFRSSEAWSHSLNSESLLFQQFNSPDRFLISRLVKLCSLDPGNYSQPAPAKKITILSRELVSSIPRWIRMLRTWSNERLIFPEKQLLSFSDCKFLYPQTFSTPIALLVQQVNEKFIACAIFFDVLLCFRDSDSHWTYSRRISSQEETLWNLSRYIYIYFARSRSFILFRFTTPGIFSRLFQTTQLT